MRKAFLSYKYYYHLNMKNTLLSVTRQQQIAIFTVLFILFLFLIKKDNLIFSVTQGKINNFYKKNISPG